MMKLLKRRWLAASMCSFSSFVLVSDTPLLEYTRMLGGYDTEIEQNPSGKSPILSFLYVNGDA